MSQLDREKPNHETVLDVTEEQIARVYAKAFLGAIGKSPRAADLVDELESIRLTEELLRRWPAESAAIDERVLTLRNRATEFHAKIRDAQENPLRHVEFLQRLPKEIAAVRKEIASLTSDVVNLSDIAEADRTAIVAAREHDEQLIREQLHFEPIDTNILSAYLLQKELRGPLADVVSVQILLIVAGLIMIAVMTLAVLMPSGRSAIATARAPAPSPVADAPVS